MRACAAAGFGLAALLAAQPALAQVDVRFIAPERYTDAENRSGSGLTLRVTLDEIRRLLVGLGERVLGPSESLTIDVLDIDLAGMDRPGASFPYGVRVVSDIAPPRLRLRYVLKRGGRTLASGEETVTDPNFLLRASSVASAGSFSYERALIRDWLNVRFGRRTPSPG